jgi:hypothetical protein
LIVENYFKPGLMVPAFLLNFGELELRLAAGQRTEVFVDLFPAALRQHCADRVEARLDP